jgi:hypothetical protein
VNLDQQLLSEPCPGALQCSLYADHFNQRVYGWEPLIEPIIIDSLAWKHDRRQSLRELQIMAARSLPLNLNLTAAFVQQMRQFSNRWPSVKLAIDADFRLVTKFVYDCAHPFAGRVAVVLIVTCCRIHSLTIPAHHSISPPTLTVVNGYRPVAERTCIIA